MLGVGRLGGVPPLLPWCQHIIRHVSSNSNGICAPMGTKRHSSEQGPRPLYDVLEVDATATAEELHRAYRLRALQVHPDKNPDDPSAKEAFQNLRRAYEVLSDPVRRQQYDQFGDSR